jgi:hypothetical protein
VSSRDARRSYSGLTGGKILLACGHQNGRKDWCRLLLGLVLFRLVVPLLQLGVVGLYPVQDIWFPNHLPLEGVGSYPDLLGHNRWPMVPRVQDPNNGFKPLAQIDLLPLPLQEQCNIDAFKCVKYVKKIHRKTKQELDKKVQFFVVKANKHSKKMTFEPGDMVWVHLR